MSRTEIAPCHSPAEVAATIARARSHGIHLVPRSGGHCFAGRSTTDGIVLDVGPMRSVTRVGDVVTVGAGARLGRLYDALGDRAIPAGCGPTVGIAGLTLGGGLGVLGRRHGLTCDSLVAAEVVLADGRIVRCDDERDSDLFWALRGAGGGNFGVVTSLSFRTVAAPELTVFHLHWPVRRAEEVITAWIAEAPDAPDALAASLLANANDIMVFGAAIATEPETRALLARLTALAPDRSVLRRLPFRDAKRYLADRPDEPGTALSKSEFFAGHLPADTITALVANLRQDSRTGEKRELDFTPWGGAYVRTPRHATAFAHRDARFLVKHSVIAGSERARAWLTRSWEILRPWGTGGVYPNFPDPDLRDWARAYHGDNFARLTEVKAEYDPEGFFRFHQSVPAR
ncbi:FAD-binding oxidoreductase [Allokutzneria albata]|uniref:FAD/FMN-containing dehydrogenase n=1 Tax=Allokutzneria albata TaxID=211114 RepID=A0A1G9U6Q9_ALLAB|nr:FAD-binding oxidoreductase [Allokutzneria albata]SDM55364.1 FAD/FMN-containing dehydrogenase [Allokutzneria albata]